MKRSRWKRNIDRCVMRSDEIRKTEDGGFTLMEIVVSAGINGKAARADEDRFHVHNAVEYLLAEGYDPGDPPRFEGVMLNCETDGGLCEITVTAGEISVSSFVYVCPGAVPEGSGGTNE